MSRELALLFGLVLFLTPPLVPALLAVIERNTPFVIFRKTIAILCGVFFLSACSLLYILLRVEGQQGTDHLISGLYLVYMLVCFFVWWNLFIVRRPRQI